MTIGIPDWVTPDTRKILELVLTRLDEIGATMATQADLQAFADRVTTATENVRADIQRFIDAHPDLDTSPLESAVSGLEGLAAEHPEPPTP